MKKWGLLKNWINRLGQFAQKLHWRALLACGVAVSVLGVVLLSAFTSSGESGGESLYKETSVQRGDIIAGVTESGTATVQAVAAAFPEISAASTSDSSGTSTTSSSTKVAATVEELFVKAGQEVKKGDPIARLSTGGIADTLDDLDMQLKKAQVSLESSRISQQMEAISAGSTLKQNQAKSQTAQLQYEITLKQIQNELASSKLSLDEVQLKIDDYESKLDGALREDYNLDDLKDSYDSAVDDLDALQNTKEYGSSTTIGSSGDTLDDQITKAKQTMTSAKSAYNNAISNYEKAMDEARAQLDSLYIQFEAQTLQMDSAQASAPLEEITAETQKDQDESTAGTAGALYEVQLAQLANSVASQELSVQAIQKKIDALGEYEGSDGTLYAPCSGLVMSVAYDVGDSVDWSADIATIANSGNVYLVVSIAQEDISEIALGKAASISMGAYEGKQYVGVVDSISVTPAMSGSSTVSYMVKVKLDGDTTGIYEGMTGDVTFITKEVKDVLYVSNRAIAAEDGKQVVQMYGSSGAVEKVEVSTGFSDGRNVEVSSGLKEGDVVLIESQVAAK